MLYLFKVNFEFNNYIEFKSKTEKEILGVVIKGIKEHGFEKIKCIDSEKLDIVEKKFDKFLIDYNYTPASELISNNLNKSLPKLNFDLKKLGDYFKTQTSSADFVPIETDLKNINAYYSTLGNLISIDKENEFEKELATNTEFTINVVFYLFSTIIKAFVYILNHPNFFLTQTSTEEYLKFFINFRTVKRLCKKCIGVVITESDQEKKKNMINEAYMSSFVEMNQYIMEFKNMIGNCQNFLTLILFNIGANNSDEEEEEEKFDIQMLDLLMHFTKSFKTLYLINKKYSLVDYREFYNDGLSKNLNFKRECKVYNEILKKDFSKENQKKPFCLISYNWLFDAAAKSEILYVFNERKQRIETIQALHNLEGGMLGLPQIINPASLFFYLQIRRNNIIEDTLNAVSNSNVNLQKPLKVKFMNEQGVDEGGVRKEFFLLLVRQIFDANYGMFSYNDKTRLFWFNLYSFEPKIKYELIGIILGLALFNNVILDIKFPLVIYKKLLELPLSLEDMKECDPELYQTLSYLKNTKEQNLKDLLSTNFTVVVDKFGEKVVIPLKPDGENIYIDNTNKDEYVDLYLDWYFNKSIEEYFVCFKKGFYRVCDKQLAKLLKSEELELIICGTQTLDFHELEKATHYEDGYDKNSVTCRLFWEVLHSFNEEEKKKFLFFVTGCDRAPINGLGSLVITISRFGPDSDKLPCAHTCFNHLLLPDYQNKEKLEKCLRVAISNSEGFGLI